MEQTRRYDAVIIGAGQAGVPLARSLAGAGWRTALVERTHVGGTCVNEGCTPSKTMAASARVAYLARRADDYGVTTGEVTVDMAAVQRRTQAIVDSWREGGRSRLEATPRLDLIMGEARFTGARSLEVTLTEATGSEQDAALRLEAERVFIDTGARPAIPALPGLTEVPYLDSTTIMQLETLPEHLLVLGGGYIAVEFGQMFRRFGSEVTIVQRRSTLLPREDEDVAQALMQILHEDGVRIITEASATAVRPTTDANGTPGVELDVTTSEGTQTLQGSHLLVATGRTPNTEALDLDAAGVRTDERGYIPVDEFLRTSVSGIYALGDVNGGPAFTHVSYDDYRVVESALLGGGSRTTKDRLVPYVIYTDPQLGRVGLSEREAREKDIDVDVHTMPMSRVARALETDEPRGLMKVLTEKASGRIVGCAVLGIEGGEIMSLLQAAMLGGVDRSTLKDMVFAHPTLAEALNNLFAD